MGASIKASRRVASGESTCVSTGSPESRARASASGFTASCPDHSGPFSSSGSAPGCETSSLAWGSCAVPAATPVLDARFGLAAREAWQAQRLSPSATAATGASGDPSGAPASQGLDGQAAVQAVKRYREAFRAVPGREPTANWIGGSAAP